MAKKKKVEEVDNTMELYKRHRPTSLDDVVGQKDAVTMIKNMLKRGDFPRFLLLTGPSGCGKSTIARIMKRELSCGDMDFRQVNCALMDKPLETIKELKKQMGMSPMSGDCRVFLLEESQALSRAGFTQQALLEMLEDTPKHVYFMMATTNPEKLLPTIRSRATEIKLSLLTPKHLETLITSICEKEDIELDQEILEQLIETSEGSARKALVILHQIRDMSSTEEQLKSILHVDSQKISTNIATLLMDSRTKWPEVAKVLKNLEDDPETIRRAIIGYCSAIMLNSPKKAGRANWIITCLSVNLIDTGKAGLSSCIYEVLNGGDV